MTVKGKTFKEGDRVWVEGCGAGTVTDDTYNALRRRKKLDDPAEFTTLTPVLFDDYLGQKFPLAVETESVRLLSTVPQWN